ncbi:MAG: hypothetical protein H6526_08870 [Actinobacteria bacterium]|nr:hypothetical protein [Actinomycetota bacterium]
MTTLTLADVKPYLGQSQNINDAEVQVFIAAAESAVEQRVGPLVIAEQTSVVRGSGTCDLALPVCPVASATSVTGKSGSTVAVDWISERAGVLHFESALSEDYYTVVYNAGWAASAASVPADLLLAVKELVRHLYRTQRGPVPAQGGQEPAGAAYAFPNRVLQLLQPYMSPGFA